MSILQTIVDGNTDVFRYGLYKYNDPSTQNNSLFEDPTLLGFTVEIDEINSPLFNGEAENFLIRYSNIDAIKSRIVTLKEFQNNILRIFKSQESAIDNNTKNTYIKSHYINSISNLNLLTNKFIQYKKDILKIELYEDIGMSTTYLSNLYNNLIYSYNSGRTILPENLQKFHLNIKISEIRNFNSMSKYLYNSTPNNIEERIQFSLKNNVTCIIYTLWDCDFNFFETKPFEDTISQAGIETNLTKYSVNNLNIYFKSVSRFMRPSLLSGLIMNDGYENLGFNLNGTVNSNRAGLRASSDSINIDGSIYQKNNIEGVNNKENLNSLGYDNETNKKTGILNNKNYNTDIANSNDENKAIFDYLNQLTSMQQGELVDKELANYDNPDNVFKYYLPLEGDNIKYTLNASGLPGVINTNNSVDMSSVNPESGILTRLANKAASTLEFQINRGLNKLRQQRAELITTTLYDIRKYLNIQNKKITPDNVYKEYDLLQLIENRVVGEIGFSITDELLNTFNTF